MPESNPNRGWYDTLPPAPPARRLEQALEVDAAIVGAGLTGLAVARRLAEIEPGWRIAMLEARRAGSGASGRASGFVVDLTDFSTRWPARHRNRYVALARSGIEELRRLVERFGIECAWDETGWIRAAAGAEGERFLESLPPLFDELGITWTRLSRDALRAVTGSTFYRSGIRLPGYPLVHTAALTRGLLEALPSQIELYEETPVTAVEGGPPYQLVAAGQRVKAERLFLTVNGYTPCLGFLGRRIFPVYTFGALTRILRPDQQERLGGESEWGILAMDAMGSSVRRTRDQRILIRNTLHYDRQLEVNGSVARRVSENLRRAFLARFPMLADVELEHTWSCLMGGAHNGQLSFGEVARNLFVAAAYSAAGIAMATTAGRLLAEQAAGIESGQLDDLLALPRPTWMPPEPLRSLGGTWLVRRMNDRAGSYL